MLYYFVNTLTNINVNVQIYILDKLVGNCQSDNTEVGNHHIYPRSEKMMVTPLS